LLIAININWRP